MPATRCRTGSVVCQISVAVVAAAGGPPGFAAPDVTTRPIEVRTEPSPQAPVTGTRLRQTLDAPVAGLTWGGVPLRDALREAGEAFSVAIVRDRRIDPTRPANVEVSNVPLRDVLAEAAAGADGEVRVVGNVAYLGPPDAAEV